MQGFGEINELYVCKINQWGAQFATSNIFHFIRHSIYLLEVSKYNTYNLISNF